jgi:hypothetical protein
MSHYAQYAIGKYRVDTQQDGNSQGKVTAYEGTDDPCVVIVNMGTGSSDASITLPDQFARATAIESSDKGVMREKSVDMGTDGITLHLAARSIVSIKFEK